MFTFSDAAKSSSGVKETSVVDLSSRHIRQKSNTEDASSGSWARTYG